MAISEPTGIVLVEILENKSLQFDKKPVEKQELSDALSSQMQWHRLWDKDPKIIVRAAASTPTSVVQMVIEKSTAIGFEDFSLRVAE